MGAGGCLVFSIVPVRGGGGGGGGRRNEQRTHLLEIMSEVLSQAESERLLGQS